MAVESITVGTLVSRVAHLLTNSATADTATGNEIKFALGFLLKRLVSETRYNGFRKEGTKAASTQDFALPDDFLEMTMRTMRFSDSPKYPIPYLPQQYFDESSLPLWLASTGRPKYFNIRGRDATTGLFNIRLFPTPDTTYNLVYWYQAAPANITSATSDAAEFEPRFPRDHLLGLIYGVALYFPQYTSASQRQEYRFEYERCLKALRADADPLEGEHYQGMAYNPGHRRGTLSWPTTLYTGSPIV